MQLTDLLNAFRAGDLSEDEFATGLGIPVANLRHRMTLWGNRLPTLLYALDGIAEGTLQRKQVADLLGVSTRQVNKLMETWQVKRPIGLTPVQREQTKVKRLVQYNAAIDFISGRRDLKKAADDAHLGDRQMRRWVSQLLGKHHQGMTWGEFHGGIEERIADEGREKRLYSESAQQWREGLARTIRREADLENSRETLARALSARKLKVQEVAVDNVVSRRRGVA